MEYKKLLNPLLNDVEGNRPETYDDHKGIPTIGAGLNLNDGDVQGLMKISSIDPDEVRSGTRKLASEELEHIKNSYIDKREKLVRNQMGSDLFDTMPDNEKAAVMSMGYQSLNLLGPSLVGNIANGDKIGAMREMILNSNKNKNPGILNRRFKEAELYGGPLDFSSTFKTLSDEEKQGLVKMINGIENEHTKKEVLEKYGPYLGQSMPKMGKIEEMLKPKLIK